MLALFVVPGGAGLAASGDNFIVGQDNTRQSRASGHPAGAGAFTAWLRATRLSMRPKAGIEDLP